MIIMQDMKNKFILYIIVIFLCNFSGELKAGDYIDDLIQLVNNSPNNWHGNRQLTLKALEYYKKCNDMYKKRDKFLSFLEGNGRPYISIDFIYNNGVQSDSFLLTDRYLSTPSDLFKYHYRYRKDIFNNLLAYGEEASKKYIYTGDFCDVTPHAFIVIRVFKDKQRYYSIFIEPSNILIKGENEEVTSESFNASYKFCSFILYEYLINNTSRLLKRVFASDDFLRFQERIEKY